MVYDTTPNRNLVNEASVSYDDPFVLLYHDQLDALLEHAKPTALAVFLALLKRANRKQGDSCFPSLDTIAKDAHVSRKTVTTSLRELKELGLVTIEQRYKEDGSPTSNLYRIHRLVNSTGGSVNPIPTQGIKFAPPSPQNLHPNYTNYNHREYELEGDPPPKKRQQKTATPVPDEVSEAAKQWAVDKKGLPPSVVEVEAEKFLYRNRAHDAMYKDWDSAFRQWITQGLSKGWIESPPPTGRLSQEELRALPRSAWKFGVYPEGHEGSQRYMDDRERGTLRQLDGSD